jgi:hypothetical protein
VVDDIRGASVERLDMISSIIAAVSLWFNKTTCMQIRWLLRRHSSLMLRKGAPLRWSTMSDDLEKHGAFYIISVIAPRWNCHALLARLSPIWIDRSFTLELADFGLQADSWSMVLYDASLKTQQWVGSATISQKTVTWYLPPAAYTLSLRYYTDRDDIEVPTVVIDGSVRVVGGKIAGEAPRYKRHLETIRNRSGPVFRLLHYHVFYNVSRKEKCAAFLRRQFLPVGNPDTEWNYGHLAVGERLRVHSNRAHQKAFNTYVCFYNWASFPVEWLTIETLEWCGDAFDQAVGYAIRRVRKEKPDASQKSEIRFEAVVVTSIDKPTAIRRA